MPSTTSGLPLRERLLMKQAWVYCFITSAVLILLLVVGPIPLSWQVYGMAPLVVLLGLPHGTTDFWEGRDLFRPWFRRIWWIPFGFAYLVLSGVVVLVWSYFPEASLWLFLLASVIHFGACDSVGDYDGGFRMLNIVSRGLAPITLPTLLHGREVEAAFQALNVAQPASLLATLKFLAILPIFGLVVIGIRNFLAYSGKRRALGFEPIFEIALLTLAPPILSFGISFAFMHSSRHLIDFWADFQSKDGGKSVRTAIKSSAVIWGLTVVLGTALFVFNPIGSMPDRLIYTIFVGLAALTLPHMILELLRFSKRTDLKMQHGSA